MSPEPLLAFGDPHLYLCVHCPARGDTLAILPPVRPKEEKMEFYRNNYDGIDSYATKLIRYKAYSMVGKAGFCEADRPDLEQDMMLDLLQRLDKYNPAKASKNTFISRIVENRICTILESRHTCRRDWRLCLTSLNEKIRNCEGGIAERIDMLDTDGKISYHGAEARLWRNEELHVDVKRVVESLPAELQDLCGRLCHSNIREIARDTGIHHSKLYEWLHKIQEAFTEAGIKK